MAAVDTTDRIYDLTGRLRAKEFKKRRLGRILLNISDDFKVLHSLLKKYNIYLFNYKNKGWSNILLYCQQGQETIWQAHRCPNQQVSKDRKFHNLQRNCRNAVPRTNRPMREGGQRESPIFLEYNEPDKAL